MAQPTADPSFHLVPNNPDSTSDPSTIAHRRIDLQSPTDLIHLLHTTQSSARQKIDLHLPLSHSIRSSTTGIDSLRTSVEHSVQKYIEDVFEMVKLGVSVNGIEAESVEWEREVPEEFEGYDAGLAERIRELYGVVEGLNVGLANVRREAVARVTGELKEGFEQGVGRIDAQLDERERNVLESGADGVKEEFEDVRLGFEGREEEVRNTWETALKGLKGLEGGLEESLKEAQDAGRVVEYLEGK